MKRIKNAMKQMKEMGTKRIVAIMKQEDGIGTIELILIMVVLIGLILIFKEQLNDLMQTIFDKISSQSGTV